MVTKKCVKKLVVNRKPENGGRRIAKIDWDIVDKNLIAGANGVEIASIFGIANDTLYSHCIREKDMTFSEYSAAKKSKGDSLLKAKQFQIAMKGHPTMLIWLGKQRLGQREDPRGSSEFNGKLGGILDYLKNVKSEDDFKHKKDKKED